MFSRMIAHVGRVFPELIRVWFADSFRTSQTSATSGFARIFGLQVFRRSFMRRMNIRPTHFNNGPDSCGTCTSYC